MKHRTSLISTFVAVFAIMSLQTSSNAHLPNSPSKAVGMSTVQIKKMNASFGMALAEASAFLLGEAAGGKAKVTDSTLTTTSVLNVSKRFPCSLGGYVNTAMSLKTVLTNSTDLYVASFVIDQAVVNWKCLSGWIVNGTRRFAYGYSGLAGTMPQKMTGSVSGGWKSTGPNKAKQSCKLTGKVANASSGASLSAKVNISCVPGGVITITEKL